MFFFSLWKYGLCVKEIQINYWNNFPNTVGKIYQKSLIRYTCIQKLFSRFAADDFQSASEVALYGLLNLFTCVNSNVHQRITTLINFNPPGNPGGNIEIFGGIPNDAIMFCLYQIKSIVSIQFLAIFLIIILIICFKTFRSWTQLSKLFFIFKIYKVFIKLWIKTYLYRL